MFTSKSLPLTAYRFRKPRRRLTATVGAAFAVFVGSAWLQPLVAQQPNAQRRGEIAAPRPVELDTSDGVVLQCQFYPGGHEKETVPVILLHAWDENDGGKGLTRLAGGLQRDLGCAVLVPDLRGHGDSNRVRGLSEKLERDRFRTAEVFSALKDIEACKKFLVSENNKGELNIDLLTVVARAETCLHAMHWTLQDWSYPTLAGIKQGQDVKALVFVSPKRSFKGMNANDYVKNPLYNGQAVNPLPIMIAADERKQSAMRDASNLHDHLDRFREDEAKADQLKIYTYRLMRNVEVVPSSSGDKPLDKVIGEFISKHVVAKKDEHRWQDRSAD